MLQTSIKLITLNYFDILTLAMQVARRSLMDTVSELYEPCWDGVEEFLIKSDVSTLLLLLF